MTGELIERLEAAEAGSRFLDAMVAVAVHGGSDPQPDGSYKRAGADFWRENSRKVTTLIDSAVAMIGVKLPGWSWGAEGKGQAAIASPDDKPAIVFGAFAKTAPLALCIALLRALSKEGDQP